MSGLERPAEATDNQVSSSATSAMSAILEGWQTSEEARRHRTRDTRQTLVPRRHRRRSTRVRATRSCRTTMTVIRAGRRWCSPWDERGTWGESPSADAGLRVDPRPSQTGSRRPDRLGRAADGVHNGAYGFAAPISPVTIPSPPKMAASLPVCSMRLPLPPPIQLHPPSAAFSAPPLTDDA